MAKTPSVPVKPGAPPPGPEKDPGQDSLFREVDDDLRQEKLENFWKRWGSAIIGACIAVVAGVAGWEIYTGWQRSEAEAASARYAAAVRLADPVQRTAALNAILADAPPGYQVVAGLRRGAAAVAQGDIDAAATAYREAAAAVDDPLYDDLAVLLAVIAEMQRKGEAAASRDPAALASTLEPLTAPGRPWRYSAKELEAYLVLEAGDEDRARQLLRTLANDPATPAGIQARAQGFDRFFASR